MSEFLEPSYAKMGSKIERKILHKHKTEHKGLSEGDAKEEYIKLARSLPTYGTHFFLVKVEYSSF